MVVFGSVLVPRGFWYIVGYFFGALVFGCWFLGWFYSLSICVLGFVNRF